MIFYNKPIGLWVYIFLLLTANFCTAQINLYACDESGNGTAIFDLHMAEMQLLDSLPNLDIVEEVWITKRKTGIAKVVNPSTAPQLVNVCPANATLGDFYELAINSSQEIYVSYRWDLYRVDTNTCQYIHVTNQLPTNVIAMSFDNQNNLYAGGLNTSVVYRAEAGDFNNWTVWHDFGTGVASGDYVMIGDYMYIAWRTGGNDVLYKVTLDENNQYVSHEVLGNIYPDTYGMAGETGKLYGVTRDQLYRIYLNPFSTQLVFDNPAANWEDNWLGAAGLHEAVFYDISFHWSQADAQSGANPISPGNYSITSPGSQTLYAQVADQDGNSIAIVPIFLHVVSEPETQNHTELICDANANFTAQSFNGMIADNSYTFSYHQTAAQAESNSNPLVNLSFTGTAITYYVRVAVGDCYSIAQLHLQPAENPVLDMPNSFTICPGEAFTVTAPAGFDSYEWSGLATVDLPGNNINAQSIIVTQPGTIQLTVYNASGCSTSQSIQLIPLAEPSIISIYDMGNSIEVITNYGGSLLYSLDGVQWHSSPIFPYNSGDEITVYVQTVPNCYLVTRDFVSFQAFNIITPNGDGKNDIWQPQGLENYPDAEVRIFNRYGKLLFAEKPRNGVVTWHGKYLGRPLPGGTYWYIIQLTDDRLESGHITLINK